MLTSFGSCSDSIKDGSETDVDCGGKHCPACAAGESCGAPGDCASGMCANGTCTDTCGDRIKNGKETDVDCGGACPAKCVNGNGCLRDADCGSGRCSNRVCVGLACPDGIGFLDGPMVPTGRLPESIALGDLNGDGKPDLAVANYNDNTVSVLLNQGNGAFTAKVDYAAAAGPWSVALGDLNGDGSVDLVVANDSQNQNAYAASVLLNMCLP